MSQDRTKRYSETLPPEQGERVRRIIARHGDRFQTRELQAPPESESFTIRRWAEARRNAETGLWNVREYNERANYLKRDEEGGLSNGTAIEQTTLLSGACFFDALRLCAEYETYGLQEAATSAVQSRDEIGDAHFRAFAEKEGIVFDARDNMPVPVINGEIMNENCVLDAGALKVAERAAGNLQAAGTALVPKIPEMFNVSALVPAGGGVSTSQLIENFAQQSKAQNVIADRGRQLKKLDRAIDDAAMTDFKKFGYRTHDEGNAALIMTNKAFLGGSAAFGASIYFAPFWSIHPGIGVPLFIGGLAACLGGLVTTAITLTELHDEGRPILQSYGENGFVFGERAFNKELKKTRKMAAQLPSEDMRNAAGQMLGQIELGYRALSARAAFQRAAVNHGVTAPFSRYAMKREINKFIKTAGRLGMDDEMVNQILAAMQSDPDSSGFEQKIGGGIADQIRALQDLANQAQGMTRSNTQPRLTHK